MTRTVLFYQFGEEGGSKHNLIKIRSLFRSEILIIAEKSIFKRHSTAYNTLEGQQLHREKSTAREKHIWNNYQQNKIAGVYSDPYVRPFVCSSIRPSDPPNL